MLDNFKINALNEAVQQRANAGLQHIEIEASGALLKRISVRLTQLVLIEFPLVH